MSTYLPKTDFDPADPSSYYAVEIDEDGPVVYSECCSDRMGLGTALLLHEALGRWIAAQQASNPADTADQETAR
jgi:hypothetical protein